MLETRIPRERGDCYREINTYWQQTYGPWRENGQWREWGDR